MGVELLDTILDVVQTWFFARVVADSLVTYVTQKPPITGKPLNLLNYVQSYFLPTRGRRT